MDLKVPKLKYLSHVDQNILNMGKYIGIAIILPKFVPSIVHSMEIWCKGMILGFSYY